MGLADHLVSNLKQKIESLALEPGGGGRFEVLVDGELVYSKLATGEFPDDDEILRQVTARTR